MSDRLIQAVETALSRLAQEVHKDASVVVQYAAGDWHELKAALGEAKGETPPAEPVAVEGSAAPAASESPPPPAEEVVAPADSNPAPVEPPPLPPTPEPTPEPTP